MISRWFHSGFDRLHMRTLWWYRCRRVARPAIGDTSVTMQGTAGRRLARQQASAIDDVKPPSARHGGPSIRQFERLVDGTVQAGTITASQGGCPLAEGSIAGRSGGYGEGAGRGTVGGRCAPAAPHPAGHQVPGLGGAERLLVDMVARGDRQAFDYEVAYVLAAEDALVPDRRAAGTPVHCARRPRATADLRWMGRLRRLLVDGRFDVVHFHLPYTAALGRLVVATIPADRRPAVVYTEHSLWNKMAVLVRGLNRATIGRSTSR